MDEYGCTTIFSGNNCYLKCLIHFVCVIRICVLYPRYPAEKQVVWNLFFWKKVVVDSSLLMVVLVLFLAALIRSTFGFGDALISMPLLSLFLPIATVVAPLVSLISILTSCLILSSDWRTVHWSSTWKLLISAIAGIPVGMYGARHVDEWLVKLFLASLILSFAGFNLWKPRLFTLKSDHSIWVFGFSSGIFGGAYNAFGPPLVIFGTLRQWSPAQFRSTIQGYALPVVIFVVIGHSVAGFQYERVFNYFLIAGVFVTLAVAIGRRIHHRFQGDRFRQSIYVLLFAVGTMLALQSIRA